MSFLLTLIALGAVVTLTFFQDQLQLTPEMAQQLQISAVALLVLSALLQLVGLFRRKPAEKAAPVVEKTPEVPQLSIEAEVEAQVLQFVARLQEKGRFIDFAMDDITPYSNEDVGAAARVVHQGCREVLEGVFDIRKIHPGDEGEAISLAADFDAKAYRLVGKVPEQAPFNGTVLHRGWKTTKIALPKLTEEAREASAREVIAPAEVEIG